MTEAKEPAPASPPQQTSDDTVVLVCPCCGKNAAFSKQDVMKALMQARKQQAAVGQHSLLRKPEQQSDKTKEQAPKQPPPIRAAPAPAADKKPWSESLRMATLALSCSGSCNLRSTSGAPRARQQPQQKLQAISETVPVKGELPARRKRDPALARWLKEASIDEEMDLYQFEAALVGAGWNFERLKTGRMVTKEELRAIGVHQPHRRALFHEIKLLRGVNRQSQLSQPPKPSS